MATTVRKKKKPASARKKVTRKKKVLVSVNAIDVIANSMEMKGDKLVVPISRDTHPEIFELDQLSKQIRKMIKSYTRRKRTRNMVNFLAETEKSLQIILKNHLEDAMLDYLK
ncbi:MAG: hypothetical protein JRG94_06990 [Deltaproteobacteria bacterium]|nr:hypothetical protein [Deltaproteobacteria bacterium]